jgi:hypothetical protein
MRPSRLRTRAAAAPDLWLKLADLRRGEYPEDALGVYRRHVEDVIAGALKSCKMQLIQRQVVLGSAR